VTTNRLTLRQQCALVDLIEVPRSTPYQTGISVRTFRVLQKHGYAECVSGSGEHSIWTATPAGTEALKAALQQENNHAE
jgi:hypothetical protein